MPRGRERETPHAARLKSEKLILEALEKAGPDGLRFNELRKETGLHQDTLTERLHSMRRERKVAQNPYGRYVIMKLGLEDLALANLVFLIDELGPSHGAIGGPESGSVRADERALMRSSVFYAIPPLPLDWLVILRRAIHEAYAALKLLSVCKVLDISLSEILTGPHQVEVLERLKTRSLRGKQILACVIDSDVLRDDLSVVYLRRIARVAAVLQRREGIVLGPRGSGAPRSRRRRGLNRAA